MKHHQDACQFLIQLRTVLDITMIPEFLTVIGDNHENRIGSQAELTIDLLDNTIRESDLAKIPSA